MDIDMQFISQCLVSFADREKAKYRNYVARLVDDGRLMRVDDEEAACCRVLRERYGDDE